MPRTTFRSIRVTFRSITAGDVLTVTHNKHAMQCKFLGFTDNHTAYSVTAVFDNAAALLARVGVKSFRDLESIQDATATSKGYSYRAVFLDQRTMVVFAAILSDGRWTIGSSNDRCKLSARKN